jgi:molybdate-binding protein
MNKEEIKQNRDRKTGARQSLQSYINGHRTQKRQDHGYEKNKGGPKKGKARSK